MSNIEWTDKTWNPVVGCTPVSPGCLNCYAARMAMRLETMGVPGYQRSDEGIRIAEVRGGRSVFTGDVRTLDHRLTEPLKWRKPRMVFVNSQSDLFHESVPFEFIDRVFAVMALCPQHTFQVLTKRPERMREYVTRDGDHPTRRVRDATYQFDKAAYERLDLSGDGWPLPNVWLGVSVEDQARADERIPVLMQCPAAVRFLSCEPLLGPVDMSAFFGGAYVGMPGDVVHPNYNFGIGWVIVGGESGPKARSCDVAWIRSIVKRCKAAGVACFVKQLGASVEMTFDEWNALTSGGACGSSRFTLLFQGCDLGYWKTNDPKGGDPAEWPEDLCVRGWPKGGA